MTKFAESDGSLEIRQNAELAVLENSKWVDNVLWAQATVGFTVVVAKLAGVTEVEWQQVKINVSSVWLVFIVLTIAHLYTSLLLIKALRKFWHCSDIQNLFEFDHRERVRWGNWVSLI